LQKDTLSARESTKNSKTVLSPPEKVPKTVKRLFRGLRKSQRHKEGAFAALRKPQKRKKGTFAACDSAKKSKSALSRPAEAPKTASRGFRAVRKPQKHKNQPRRREK